MHSAWRRGDVAQLLSLAVTALMVSVLACSDATGPKNYRFSCYHQGSDKPVEYVISSNDFPTPQNADDAKILAQANCDRDYPPVALILPDGTKFVPYCKCTLFGS